VKFDDRETVSTFARIEAPSATPRAGLELSAQQNQLVAEFGPPDSFVLAFMRDAGDSSASGSRMETWQYHDLRTAFSFVDGRFLSSEPLANLPPRAIPQAFRPEQFLDGMSWEEVRSLVGESDFATLDAADLAPGIEELRGITFVASRDALFGFGPVGLAYVQAVPAGDRP
jgi:hypothetical protein